MPISEHQNTATTPKGEGAMTRRLFSCAEKNPPFYPNSDRLVGAFLVDFEHNKGLPHESDVNLELKMDMGANNQFKLPS